MCNDIVAYNWKICSFLPIIKQNMFHNYWYKFLNICQKSVITKFTFVRSTLSHVSCMEKLIWWVIKAMFVLRSPFKKLIFGIMSVCRIYWYVAQTRGPISIKFGLLRCIFFVNQKMLGFVAICDTVMQNALFVFGTFLSILLGG